MKPAEVLDCTPREFSILLRAYSERIHDDYERMSVGAIMHEQAAREKRPKASDLYKRPINVTVASLQLDDMKEKAEHATEWLSQFTNFRD